MDRRDVMHRLLLGLGLALFVSHAVSAAPSAPDAGTLLRETERETVPPARPQPAPLVIPETPAGAEAERRVLVKGFRITGATLFTEAELQKVLEPYVGRELSFHQLQQAADAIAAHYRRQGRFARAYLPQQDIKNGVVTIAVIEGRMGQVRIDDGGKTLRLKRTVAESYLNAAQTPGEALRLDEVERSIRLLNDLPGVSAAAMLKPGNEPGEVDVVARLEDKPLFAGSLQLDNFGTRSTGHERLTGAAFANNPSGFGDQIGAIINTSQGVDYGRLSYTLPAGYDGLQVGANVSRLKYRLGKEFASLDAHGTASTYGASANYPFLRTATHNLSGFFIWDNRDYVNNSGATQTSDKNIHAATLGLNADHNDSLGGGGYSLASLAVVRGDLDLSPNAANLATDQAGPNTDGNYTKVSFNIGRLQRLAPRDALWLSLSGQRASRNLDSSEKFSLGGPSGVRAYPVSEASGDEGWLFTAEWRHSLRPDLQLIAFYDTGSITVNDTTWSSWNSANPALSNRYHLSGVGTGLVWSKPADYMVRLSAATRLGDNPGRDANNRDNDGTRHTTRFWLSGIKYF